MTTIHRIRIIAFSFLLLLFIAAIALSFVIRDRQQYDAALINIVGRQRMLVQQIMLEVSLVQTFPDAEYRRAFHDTAYNDFETTLISLISGGQITLPTGEVVIVQPSPGEEIQEHLSVIQASWEEIDHEIHIVLDKDSRDEDIKASIEKIISLNPHIIFELDQAVQLYEFISNDNIARLQIIQFGLLAITILVLGVVIMITNRRILHPILSLGKMATQIGKGDLDTEVSVVGLKEINLLAKHLDEMREKLRTSMQVQTTMLALSQCHLKTTQEQEAIECAVETAARILEANYSAVALFDSKDRLIVRATWGIPSKQVKGMDLERGKKSQTGYTILKGTPVLVSDYSELTEFSVPPLVSQLKISSGLSVPMFSSGKIVGAMLVHSKTPHHFKQDAIPILSLIANQTAITVDKIRLFDETRQFAFTDELTGLYNRRYFIKLAEQEINRAVRYRHPQAFVMFDLDRFKQVNDTYGHPAGDEVLKTIASLASQELRDIDLIGRYGGEEFVILLPETSQKGAWAFAERLRKRIALTRMKVGQTEISITISVGISALSPDCTNLTQLIESSDKALYAAKVAGRNRTVCAT